MTRRSQISLFEAAGGAQEAARRSRGPDADVASHRQATSRHETPPTAALSVSQLNARARELLERAFPTAWVMGELGNWHRASSGHCYFTLRDEQAQLACMMWRDDARQLPTDPADGMAVYAYGRVTVFERRGRYQLVVRRLEGKGEGLWRLAFERTRRALAADGLLDPGRRRPLPPFPRRIGIVSSRTGAALRDVVTVIRRRAPWTDLLVAHCRVQGRSAAPDIVRALDAMIRSGAAELIVIARGGGSVEDLWAFNEEIVARAVAECPVPVVSAVGHEIDLTIVDLVADLRAPTPSAAGELVVPDVATVRRQLAGFGSGLVNGLRGRTRRSERRVDSLGIRLRGAIGRCVERGGARLARSSARLEALSPIRTLERGYAVPLDAGARVLRRVAAFELGLPFRLRVADGTVRCRSEGSEVIEAGDGGGA